MKQKNDYLEDLQHVRKMMQESSRFLSLSGLSGVFAGIFALAGAFYGHIQIRNFVEAHYQTSDLQLYDSFAYDALIWRLITCAVAVLIASLLAGYFFTKRKVKNEKQRLWTPVTYKLMAHFAIPLVAGGIYCFILFKNGALELVAPTTLIFYGLALILASNFMRKEIKYLGMTEMVLGLIAMLFLHHGIFFWAIGFGSLHIIYGAYMYYKYDKK